VGDRRRLYFSPVRSPFDTALPASKLSSDFREKSISIMGWPDRCSMTDVMALALMFFYMNPSV
jgi:hypothetical protein